MKFKVQETGQPGNHVVVAFGITGDPRSDVQRLLAELPEQFSAVLYAEPELGTGSTTIANADAVALAIAAKDLLRQARTKYHATCLHLMLYAPAGFCLFLGQRLNALGEIVAYERNLEGGYSPAVRLSTR